MKPHRSILDPDFRYRNSSQTDVAATFRRVRARMAAEAKTREEVTAKVRAIKKAVA